MSKKKLVVETTTLNNKRMSPAWKAKKKTDKRPVGLSLEEFIAKETTTRRAKRLVPKGDGATPPEPQIIPGTPAASDDSAMPALLDFEGQLSRVNRILQHWLKQCDQATFMEDGERLKGIAAMAKALHENIKYVLEVVRMIHELHDVRTFNRLVLEEIQRVNPEARLRIIRGLQSARAQLKSLPDRGFAGVIPHVEPESTTSLVHTDRESRP